MTIKKREILKLKNDNVLDNVYGKTITDHMIRIDYDGQNGGWKSPQIIPHGPVKVPITASSLHYGISCYEGLTIVKNRETGKLQGFKLREGLVQFLHSTNHIDMPLFNP